MSYFPKYLPWESCLEAEHNYIAIVTINIYISLIKCLRDRKTKGGSLCIVDQLILKVIDGQYFSLLLSCKHRGVDR